MEEEQRTLPPGIDGNHTGTLRICFKHCSVPNSFARIQFWGGVGYDVYPNKSISFVLVDGIAKYMRDASPLHIKILAKDATLIGNVFIPDLSLPALSLDCKRSSKGVISLRQTIIGDATFELHFLMSRPQLETDNMAGRRPCLQYVDVPDFEVDQLLDQASDIECKVRDLCGSTTQEKYSLISELLDICSDDMTIPTVDTSLVEATGVDPYDLWISNIESSAASPPRTSSQGNETVNTRSQPALETFPHPISLFLSNVATAANANANATQLRSSSATRPKARVERVPLPDPVVPPKLEPMQPPPIWIDVGVYCISNLRIVSVIGKSTSNIKSRHSLELNLKCKEPLLSLCDLVQSSAFLGNDTSNFSFSSDSVKTAEITNECSDLVSMATQLSWQVGIKSSSVNGDIEITLQLQCCCDDAKVIVGHVSIPVCKQRVECPDSLGLLPRFDANGWFDILDPNSHPIGKIQLSLASGTLKQIRSLPKAHTCAAAIQRYWRETRYIKHCITAVGEGNEAPQPDAKLSEHMRKSLGQNEDDEDDEDTIHSHPPPPPDNSDNQIHESSPDSLFEEWSQQSFLRADANEKEVFNVNAAKAAENDVGLAVDTSLVKATKTDNDIHAYATGEGGAEGNATFNPNSAMNSSASDVVELLEPFRSSHNQLDTHHNLPSMAESNSRRRQPIDPPEENDLPTKAQNEMKRKMDQFQQSSVPDAKRHRVTNASEINRPSESQVLSPPNLHTGASDKFVEEEDSSDSDDAMTYRSLQSVMKSLAGVEARLTGDKSSNAPPTSVLGCRNEEAILADIALDDRSDLTPHTTGSVKTSQMQTPSETRSNTETTVETCEKGTSPLLDTSRYKNAATSPCEEEGSIEMQDEEEGEEDGGTKDAREKKSEERGGTLKNDDMSTLQLDGSLNKLTRNHSTQELFPTSSSISSDRRERYGSLFNSERYGSLFSSQTSCPRGTLRLGSLLSPTRDDTSSYKRYLSGRTKPPDGGVSSSATSFNFDRIEQIFSGNKKKKED